MASKLLRVKIKSNFLSLKVPSSIFQFLFFWANVLVQFRAIKISTSTKGNTLVKIALSHFCISGWIPGNKVRIFWYTLLGRTVWFDVVFGTFES